MSGAMVPVCNWLRTDRSLAMVVVWLCNWGPPSSTEKSVFHLCLLLLQNVSLLEVGVGDDLLQSRRVLRIKHLKIRESAPSNWLHRLKIIHSFYHLHFSDPQHGVVEKLDKDQRIYRNAFMRLDSSVVQPCNSADDLLLLEKEDSKLKNILATLGVGIGKFWVFLSTSSPSATGSQCVSARLLAFPKESCCRFIWCRWIFKKRFPMNHKSSVCQAAGKNRGWAFHEDSEHLKRMTGNVG